MPLGMLTQQHQNSIIYKTTETIKMLKCYFGGATEPFEYAYVEACFANNQKEAKNLKRKKGRLS